MDEKLAVPSKKAPSAPVLSAPMPAQSQPANTQFEEAKGRGRKKRGEAKAPKQNTSARFFTGNISEGGIPVLEKEYESLGKAISASFKQEQPFYRLEAFRAQEVEENDMVVLKDVPVSIKG